MEPMIDVRTSSPATIRFLSVVCVALAVLLGVSKRQANRRVLAAKAEADSTLLRLSSTAARRDSLLEAGGWLPTDLLVTRDGDTVSMATLAKKYSFIYLQRADCAGCRIISAFEQELRQSPEGRIAFVNYDVAQQLAPPLMTDEYTWVTRLPRTSPTPFRGVPTLVAVRRDGRIQSIAHASLSRVRDLLDMYGMLAAEKVDSVRALQLASQNLTR